MEIFSSSLKDLGSTFMKGAEAQLNSKSTVVIATVVGIQQGTKYNGSLTKGVKAAGVTAGVICAANGLMNVINEKNSKQ